MTTFDTELTMAANLTLGDVIFRQGISGEIREAIVAIEHRAKFVRMTVECEGKQYPMDERSTKIVRRLVA